MQNQNFAGTGNGIYSHLSEYLTLGFRNILISRAGDFEDRGNGVGSISKGRYAVSTADRIHFIQSE